MTRQAKRKNDPEAVFWLAVFTGLTFGYQWVLDWDGWYRLLAVAAALASTAVLLIGTALVRGFIRDIWPAIPPELSPAIAKLQAGGWSIERAHLWKDCSEKRPHVHMSSKTAALVIVIWDGTRVLDACGNVIREEA